MENALGGLLISVLLTLSFFYSQYYLINCCRNPQNTFSSNDNNSLLNTFKLLSERNNYIDIRRNPYGRISTPINIPYETKTTKDITPKNQKALTYETIIKIDKECSENLFKINEEKEKTEKATWRNIKIIGCIFLVLAIVSTIIVGIEVFPFEAFGVETVCYVTDYGECYHSLDCGYLRSINKTTVYKAEKQGYRSCLRCSVGKLDVSIKYDFTKAFFWCFGSSTGLCILICCIYGSNKLNKAQSLHDNLKKKYIENAKKELSRLDSTSLRMCAGVPDDVVYENDLPFTKDERFIVYATYSGECYHRRSTCRGRYFFKTHAFNCKYRRPCSLCRPDNIIEEPDWHKKYIRLSNIKRHYEKLN